MTRLCELQKDAFVSNEIENLFIYILSTFIYIYIYLFTYVNIFETFNEIHFDLFSFELRSNEAQI